MSFIYISLFYKDTNLHTSEIYLKFFRIRNVAMSNYQFSARESVKNTCQTRMYYSFHQKYFKEMTCLHSTYFYINVKPVFPFGIFEMMIVLNDSFAFISALYTIKFKDPI